MVNISLPFAWLALVCVSGALGQGCASSGPGTPDAQWARGDDGKAAVLEGAPTQGTDPSAGSATPAPDSGTNAATPAVVDAATAVDGRADPRGAPDVASSDRPTPPAGAACGPLQVRDAKTLFAIAPVANRPLRLGASAGGGSPMAGDLDQIRFYDRALAPEEVARHAAKTYEPCDRPSGCVAEYTFDRLEGAAFPDSGPSGLSAAVMKQPLTLVEGVLGMAAHFDGTGWLEVAPHATLEWTHAMSFEAWVRWRGLCPPGYPAKCNFYNLFDRYGEGTTSNTGSVRPGLRLDMHIGPHLRFSMTTGVYHDDRILEAEKWVHIAVTFDDTRGARFFKNGQLHKSCVLP